MGKNVEILDSLVNSFLQSSGMEDREFTEWLYARLGKALLRHPEYPTIPNVSPEIPPISVVPPESSPLLAAAREIPAIDQKKQKEKEDISPIIGLSENSNNLASLPFKAPEIEGSEKDNGLSLTGLTVGELTFAYLNGNTLSLFDEIPAELPEEDFFGLAFCTGAAIFVISLVPAECIDWQTTKNFVESISWKGTNGALPDENIFETIKKLNPEAKFNEKVRLLQKKGIEAEKWDGSVLGPERYGKIRVFNLNGAKTLSSKMLIMSGIYRIGMTFPVNN